MLYPISITDEIKTMKILKSYKINFLKKTVELLKKEKFLTDDLTDKNIETNTGANTTSKEMDVDDDDDDDDDGDDESSNKVLTEKANVSAADQNEVNALFNDDDDDDDSD